MSDILKKLYHDVGKIVNEYFDDIDKHNEASALNSLIAQCQKLKAEIEKHKWRTDIEKAPRYGTAIALYVDLVNYGFGDVECKPHETVGFYNKRQDKWRCNSWGDAWYPNPTHWKPLTPPEGE